MDTVQAPALVGPVDLGHMEMGTRVDLGAALAAAYADHMAAAVQREVAAAVEVQIELEVAMVLVLATHHGPVAEVVQLAAEDAELPLDFVQMVAVEVAVVDAELLDIPEHRNLDLR